MKAMKLVLFSLVSIGSVAMARPSTWLMTCNDAERMVAQHPGIVMNYGYSESAGYLYKKYFPYTFNCQARKGNSGWKKAVVRTSDNDRCHIGYTCTYGPAR